MSVRSIIFFMFGLYVWTHPSMVVAEDIEVKCKREAEINFWTDDCLSWKSQQDVIEQSRLISEASLQTEQQAKRAEQQAKINQEKELQELNAIKSDNKNGYKTMSFEEFFVDGLTQQGARVAIRGLYIDQGKRLFRDPFSSARWLQAHDEIRGTSIPLIIEGASRDARVNFLHCATSNIPIGCGMVVRGRIRLFDTQNGFGVKRQELGIVVETVRP